MVGICLDERCEDLVSQRTHIQPDHKGKTMSFAKLSPAQAASIKLAKDHSSADVRKAIKKEVFGNARLAFGIPDDHKISAEIDPTDVNYGLIRNSRTRDVYRLGADGRWVDAAPVAAPAAAVRFFKVTDVAEKLFDLASYSGDYDWHDGLVAAPEGTALENDGYKAVVTATGDVYVALEESDL